jgi:hypothetical protein
MSGVNVMSILHRMEVKVVAALTCVRLDVILRFEGTPETPLVLCHATRLLHF